MRIRPILAGLALAVSGLTIPAAVVPATAAQTTAEESRSIFRTAPIYYNVVEPAVEPQSEPTTPSAITMSAPSIVAVLLGAPVTVSGKVTGGADADRTVRLELGTQRGWMPMTSVTTGADGSYSVTLPTNWYYTGRIRAFVTGTATHTSAASPATFPMTVKPSYLPLGRAGDHVVSGARWNPCSVIDYKVNTTGAPERALMQLKKAIALTARATGLTFRYAGSTTAIPYRTDNKGREWSDAALTIGWGSERQVRGLRGSVVGLGGYASWDDEITNGGVVLDRGARLRPGFKTGPTWGTLMLHEIGHSMSLNHADGPEQVMHSGINDKSPGDFQAGDLTGLAKAGAMGGCFGDAMLGAARSATGYYESGPTP